MADQKRSTEDLQREILETELETKRLQLEQTREANALYLAQKENAKRMRMQAQENAKNQVLRTEAVQKVCKHRGGATPNVNNPMAVYKGNGHSILTRSRIFFSWNWLIQCAICGLKNLTPSPNLKSRKPRRIRIDGLERMETQEEVKTRIEKYEKDSAEHKRLFEESESSKLGLPPMVGPAWEFTDQDGMQVVPEIR